jgi:hypothetical protein
MAIFRDNKLVQMEEKYLNGERFSIDDHNFTLTLQCITPYPTQILQYDWKVMLSDGVEFDAPMGSDILGYPNKRLDVIIDKLKKADRYQNDYLANAVNDKIDELYRECR